MGTKLSTEITRKQFLKLMLAAGGATTLAGFLPGKWVKPVMKVGVLPVHAQASGLSISDFSLAYREVGSESTKGSGLAKPIARAVKPAGFIIVFTYNDEFGEVDQNARIFLSVEQAPDDIITLIDWVSFDDWGGEWTGGGFSGTFSIGVFCDSSYVTNKLPFNLYLKVNGRISNAAHVVEYPAPKKF